MKPRAAVASRTGAVRLSAPRFLPIIFLPGVMGSRLADPRTGDPVWNPCGSGFILRGDGHLRSPRRYAADHRRLAQMSDELAVASADTYPGSDPEERAIIESVDGYYGLIPEFYGSMLFSLASDLVEELSPRVQPKVYCCGYDWRRDNAQAAMLLSRTVDRALRETGERKVIILAHSMGGLVSRYYARVLGGEEKIHKLILLASPTLGAIEAYTALKSGATGLYLDDFRAHIDSWSAAGRAFEGVDWTSPLDIGTAIAEAAGEVVASNPSRRGWLHTRVDVSSGAAWAKGIFGEVYVTMSLDRIMRLGGGPLTRMESVQFMRGLTSVHQLLPCRVFCRDYPRWVLFNPFKTGHAPTGFMVDVDVGLDVLSEIGAIVDTLERALGIGALGDDSDGFSENARATRNWATLGQELEKVGAGVAAFVASWPAPPGLPDPAPLFDAAATLAKTIQHLRDGFTDGRNKRALYGDIYVGFLDIPALRALSAANLEASHRFDDALTVRPRETPIDSLLARIWAVIDGAARALLAIVGPPAWGAEWESAKAALRRRLDEIVEDPGIPVDDGEPARVYMHPRTVNLYCEDLPTMGRAVSLARQVKSNDDHNVVYQLLVTAPPDLWSTNDRGKDLSLGDATVNGVSGNPSPEQLSRPFLSSKSFSHAEHGAFSNVAAVIEHVRSELCASLADYLSDGA